MTVSYSHLIPIIRLQVCHDMRCSVSLCNLHLPLAEGSSAFQGKGKLSKTGHEEKKYGKDRYQFIAPSLRQLVNSSKYYGMYLTLLLLCLPCNRYGSFRTIDHLGEPFLVFASSYSNEFRQSLVITVRMCMNYRWCVLSSTSAKSAIFMS